VDLKEGCLITNIVKYTHELAHFVNAIRDPERDFSDVVSKLSAWKRLPLLIHLRRTQSRHWPSFRSRTLVWRALAISHFVSLKVVHSEAVR
jgi:hypothetical protein